MGMLVISTQPAGLFHRPPPPLNNQNPFSARVGEGGAITQGTGLFLRSARSSCTCILSMVSLKVRDDIGAAHPDSSPQHKQKSCLLEDSTLAALIGSMETPDPSWANQILLPLKVGVRVSFSTFQASLPFLPLSSMSYHVALCFLFA